MSRVRDSVSRIHILDPVFSESCVCCGNRGLKALNNGVSLKTACILIEKNRKDELCKSCIKSATSWNPNAFMKE